VFSLAGPAVIVTVVGDREVDRISKSCQCVRSPIWSTDKAQDKQSESSLGNQHSPEI
jgi:hypothetical protein